MPRGSKASVATKKISSSNTTHVLLETDEGLIVGAKQQIESVGKENLVTGMATSLINGRKRTRGAIVCVGTSVLISVHRLESTFYDQNILIAH